MDTTKRVIILKKLNSPLISQAIFILKNDTVNEFSAVSEAERIVEEFMHSQSVRHGRSLLPFIITALAAIGIALALLIH